MDFQHYCIADGPMMRDVDSAAFVMRHLLVEGMWQSDGLAPLPWRNEVRLALINTDCWKVQPLYFLLHRSSLVFGKGLHFGVQRQEA